jgi:GNAT superfamily N-acetyltransferase
MLAVGAHKPSESRHIVNNLAPKSAVGQRIGVESSREPDPVAREPDPVARHEDRIARELVPFVRERRRFSRHRDSISREPVRFSTQCGFIVDGDGQPGSTRVENVRLHTLVVIGPCKSGAVSGTPVTASIEIAAMSERPASDAALEAVLHRVYVDEGFTPPERAASLFRASAVRARGDILCAWAREEPTRPVGLIIVVPSTSAARKIARDDEAEIHLLAVEKPYRAGGVGRRLVESAEFAAQRAGSTGVVLWTQPTMLAAQHLYATRGFSRAPARDAEISALSGRTFLVYEKRLAPRRAIGDGAGPP